MEYTHSREMLNRRMFSVRSTEPSGGRFMTDLAGIFTGRSSQANDMAKQVHTTSREGYAATSAVADFEIEMDATRETAPDTLDQLLAAYATCYVPALRVAAEQRDAGELGSIAIEVTGELNDADKLASIAFDISTDADLTEEQGMAVRDRALELCKVHDALKPDLHATISINGYGS